MAVDLQQVLVQGLTSLLGGLLGVSLGAWLGGLYKIKGEITGRAEMMGKILQEVQATAKATELSKIEARTQGMNDIVNEVVQQTRASEGAKIAARLENLDQILSEVKAVTDAQKRIEASVERRSRFEERVVLDRYVAAGTVFAQIQRVATDLNRHMHGEPVEGLFRGQELVPLTAVYETIEAQRYLLGPGLSGILEGQASEILSLGNATTAEERTESAARYAGLRKQFIAEMNRIFRIDQMDWS